MISSEEPGKEHHKSHEDTDPFVGCLGSWGTFEAHVVMQERVGTLLHPSPSCPTLLEQAREGQGYSFQKLGGPDLEKERSKERKKEK